MPLVYLGVSGWAWCVLDNVGQVSMAWSVLEGMGSRMKRSEMIGRKLYSLCKIQWGALLSRLQWFLMILICADHTRLSCGVLSWELSL